MDFALSLYSPRIPLSQANVLDQAIFAGYMDGLRDVGWTGDARLVRLGYTCAMALRGLAGVKQDIMVIREKCGNTGQPGSRFESIEDMADFWANLWRFRLLKMANEARGLLGTRNLGKASRCSSHN